MHLLDTYKGEINVGNGKIIIDKNVIDKIKFIQEGRFVEKEGAPTLKLLGDIEGIFDTENSIPTDKLFPLFAKDIQDRLELNSHDVICILWKLKIKGNSKYHSEIKTGKRSNCVNKYSENLIDVLKRMLNRPEFLRTCREDYKKEVIDTRSRKTKKSKC